MLNSFQRKIPECVARKIQKQIYDKMPKTTYEEAKFRGIS